MEPARRRKASSWNCSEKTFFHPAHQDPVKLPPPHNPTETKEKKPLRPAHPKPSGDEALIARSRPPTSRPSLERHVPVARLAAHASLPQGYAVALRPPAPRGRPEGHYAQGNEDSDRGGEHGGGDREADEACTDRGDFVVVGSDRRGGRIRSGGGGDVEGARSGGDVAGGAPRLRVLENVWLNRVGVTKSLERDGGGVNVRGGC